MKVEVNFGFSLVANMKIIILLVLLLLGSHTNWGQVLNCPFPCSCYWQIKTVDCSSSQLDTLPVFSGLQRLLTSRLILDYNQIKDLHLEKNEWAELSKLSITNNPINCSTVQQLQEWVTVLSNCSFFTSTSSPADILTTGDSILPAQNESTLHTSIVTSDLTSLPESLDVNVTRSTPISPGRIITNAITEGVLSTSAITEGVLSTKSSPISNTAELDKYLPKTSPGWIPEYLPSWVYTIVGMACFLLLTILILVSIWVIVCIKKRNNQRRTNTSNIYTGLNLRRIPRETTSTV
jgi:hypothetical protein